jgi:hypothetical protein
VLLPSAEGPSVSSPARKGGVFKGSLTRGPKDRHSSCVAPSALLLISARLIPALRPGLVSVGLSGLTAKIRHRNCEQQRLGAQDAENVVDGHAAKGNGKWKLVSTKEIRSLTSW